MTLWVFRAETNLLEQEWIKKGLFWKGKFIFKALPAGSLHSYLHYLSMWAELPPSQILTWRPSTQLMQRALLLPLTKARPCWIVCGRRCRIYIKWSLKSTGANSVEILKFLHMLNLNWTNFDVVHPLLNRRPACSSFMIPHQRAWDGRRLIDLYACPRAYNSQWMIMSARSAFYSLLSSLQVIDPTCSR